MPTTQTFHVGDLVTVPDTRRRPAGTYPRTVWQIDAVNPGFDCFPPAVDLVLPGTTDDDDAAEAMLWTTSADRCVAA